MAAGLTERLLSVLAMAMRHGIAEWLDVLVELACHLLHRASTVDPKSEEVGKHRVFSDVLLLIFS